MKVLLKILLKNKRHFLLLPLTLIGMLGLTLTSQMEILSLGVVVRTGPEIFGLLKRDFSPDKNQVLTYREASTTWEEITGNLDNPLTKENIAKYQTVRGKRSFFQRLTGCFDKIFNFSSNFYGLALFLIVVACLKAISLFSYRFFNQKTAIRISRDLRKEYFCSIQALPLSFYHEHDIGNLSNRVIVDSENIALSVNALFINYLQAPFTLLSTVWVCSSISWKLTVFVFLGFPVFVLPIMYLARKIKSLARSIQKNQDGFSSVLIEFLSGIMTVKLFGSEGFSFTKYSKHNDKIACLEEKSARYGLAPRPLLHAVSSLFFAFVIVTGIYHLNINPTELMVFCGLLYLVYEPIKKFADENTHIMKGVAAAERMNEIFLIRDERAGIKEPEELQGFHYDIEFRNVTFGYYPGEPVITDISFNLKKGESLGIVGPTGSGKSTIAKLLTRLYDVTSGEILIDGRSIYDYTPDSLRKHIACVPQETFLFYDTIHNNLTLGNEFKFEEIDKALSDSFSKEFIMKLPGGCDYTLEETGKNLSGGQQQRLSIARALLKKASILVLDEATSALDALSESYIKDVLERTKDVYTQIIIAHKLSTLEHVDKIIYLKAGKKIAEGSKEELLNLCQEFKLMWETGYGKLGLVEGDIRDIPEEIVCE
ncbi:MAG: ABC transporter ATP-binding protein [Victivallaceae bacterium]